MSGKVTSKSTTSFGEFRIPQIILGIISLFGAFAATYYVSQTFEPGSFLRRLISPSDSMIENSVPFTIIVLWIWTMLDVAVKAGLGARRQRHLGALRGITQSCQSREIECLLEEVEKRASRGGLAFSRIAELARQLTVAGNQERAHEHYRHQLEIDADQAAGSYTLAKVYIWAMPIVGFIGTVIGIGLAVAEFSSFLTADMGVDDIQKVKGALAEVAGGLSFAFDTTLLGLTASLVAMLVMSFVQRSEESFFSSLEELGLGVITTWGGGEATVAGDMGLAELKGRLQDTMSRLEQMFADFGNGLVSQLDGLGRAVSPLSGRVTASMEMLRGSVEAKAAEIERVRLQGDASGARVEQAVLAMSRQLEQLRDILTALRADLSTRVQAERSLSDDTRAHVDGQIVHLLERIGQELRTSLDAVRRDASRVGSGRVLAWPRWAGVGAGVSLLLLATGAASMVVGLQRIGDMARTVQDGDQALSSRITELASSLEPHGGPGTTPAQLALLASTTAQVSPEAAVGPAGSSGGEHGASDQARRTLPVAEARPGESDRSEVPADLVAGSSRPADPESTSVDAGPTATDGMPAARVAPPIETAQSTEPGSVDLPQAQALPAASLRPSPDPSSIASVGPALGSSNERAAPEGTVQVPAEPAQSQIRAVDGTPMEPARANAMSAAEPSEGALVETRINEWLQAARSALDQQYLLTPADQSAFHWTSRVLDRDPANAEALALRSEMLQRYLVWAETSISRRNLDAARHNLQKADRLTEYGSDTQLASLERLKKQVSDLSRARARPAPARTEQPRPASGPTVDETRQRAAIAALEPVETPPMPPRAPVTPSPRPSEPTNPLKAVTDHARAAGGEIKQAWKRVMDSMP
jgi:biopolymer transport protein ExbB/TolQ